MSLHYLDNAATTQVIRPAADAAVHAMCEVFGNPSSLHEEGARAKELVKTARSQVAGALGCKPEQIIFTSGGSEGDNTAIFGAARKCRHQGKHIITTTVEHPAVAKAIGVLEHEGYSVTRIAPQSDGRILVSDVEAALRSDTILVSIMHVNNETGAVMPIREIADMLKRRQSRALFHCDGVQAFMKVPGRVDALGVDFYAVSGHKVHAPKGIGALYIRQGVKIPAHIVGGGQENDMRSGTESVPLMAAFGEAVANTPKDASETILALRNHLLERLADMPYVRVNFPDALPCVISLSLPGLKAENVLNVLDSREIYVSTGSACAKGTRSKVLEACGLPIPIIDSSLRISLSWTNTLDDIGALADGLAAAYARFNKSRAI